jgi:endonuclease/exonuclease/phosphatase (EEP) superfamily protein YafD
VDRIDARLAGLIASWALVAPWAAWALVRTLGIGSGFPVEALLAFTPIVAATAIVPLAVAALARNWPAVAVAAVAALALGLAVLPRAFGGPTEPEGSAAAELRVLAANMKLGKAAPEPLVELVRDLDADVLSVEELTPHLAARLDAAGLRELLPDRVLATEAGAGGGGLYARGGLGPGDVSDLPGGFPLISQRLALAGAAPVEVASVHITPPVSGQTDDWAAGLDAIPRPIAPQLRIALGDFNATLDHPPFRELLDRGYDDAGSTLGAGLTGTWPANRRIPPFAAIDHVLADRRIGIRDYSVHDLPGSDHRAVFATLAIPPP